MLRCVSSIIRSKHPLFFFLTLAGSRRLRDIFVYRTDRSFVFPFVRKKVQLNFVIFIAKHDEAPDEDRERLCSVRASYVLEILSPEKNRNKSRRTKSVRMMTGNERGKRERGETVKSITSLSLRITLCVRCVLCRSERIVRSVAREMRRLMK